MITTLMSTTTIIPSCRSNGSDSPHRRRRTDFCNGAHVRPHATPIIPPPQYFAMYKRHLDRFGRFCTVHSCAQHTRYLTTSVATAHIQHCSAGVAGIAIIIMMMMMMIVIIIYISMTTCARHFCVLVNLCFIPLPLARSAQCRLDAGDMLDRSSRVM